VLTLMTQAQQNTPNELQGSQVVSQGPVDEPTLPPEVVSYLGERLRAYYSHLMNDPIPGSFIRILETMDQNGKASRDC
jgi:Anti-sigma factor NepR